jgi:hypothetical protein
MTKEPRESPAALPESFRNRFRNVPRAAAAYRQMCLQRGEEAARELLSTAPGSFGRLRMERLPLDDRRAPGGPHTED